MVAVPLTNAVSDAPSGVNVVLTITSYYGAPIHAEGTYAMESSRISFDNLLQVVLGSLGNSWDFDSSDPVAVAQLIRSMGDASNAFLYSKRDSRSLNRKSNALGRTRGSKILA